MNTNRMAVYALALGALLIPALAQADPYNGNANGRLAEQNVRIEQGIRSDQLARRDQFNLQGRDREVRFQADRGRFFHEGRLTKGERSNFNCKADHNSNVIYRDKHIDQARW